MSFDTPNPPYNASDPYATFVNASCFDFLLIELVPLAARVSTQLAASDSDDNEEWTGEQSADARKVKESGSTVVIGENLSGAAAIPEDKEARESLQLRLEALGYRVGLGIAERFTRDRPRFTDALDVIKFLCKDLWILLFRKQIDNLKTNHRGVYVLTDNAFKPLSRISFDKGQEDSLDKAQPFLYFPAGIVRGALASLGIAAAVQAKTAALPGAEFHIKTTKVTI